MNYEIYVASEIKQIEDLTQIKMQCKPAKWLDIAFKLDYISLKEKETVNSLIVKYDRAMKENVNQRFNKKDYLALKRMCEIISNTVFSKECIESAMK